MSNINFIVTPAQMKNLEIASHNAGVSFSQLMDNAGENLANFIKSVVPKQSKICFLCGSGNNGGDGFVAANILSHSGYSVTVATVCGDAKTEISINAFTKLCDIAHIKSCVEILSLCNEVRFDVVVDCVFGTGFHGEFSDKIAMLFKKFNQTNCIKIACDIPSGVCALNGTVAENTLKCDYTVTFGATKTGMLLPPANALCGKIIPCDIGIPFEVLSNFDFNCTHLDLDFLSRKIPERKALSHKGNYGKLLNISGCKNYVGASMLSTLSALRSGVGLFTLASTEYVAKVVATKAFEATYLPLSSDENGMISKENTDAIIDKCKSSDAVLFGCGCGRSDTITSIAKEVIKNTKCPLIIDADGINAILDCIDILKNTEASIIVTPHIGELSRLCGVSTAEAFEKRFELALNFAKEYNVTVVAKGSGSVIATPKGELFFSTTGNAGLSRGGSGDVLAGIIASFSAQGLSPTDSACVGTFLHGHTADIVAQKKSMQGMLPSDLIEELPFVFKSFNR